MNWIYYILEVNLYVSIFYVFYKLILQHTTFYNANRYYLILAVVASFIIPLVQLGFLKPHAFIDPELNYHPMPLELPETKTIEQTPALAFEDYVLYFYIILVFFLGLRFLIAISKIIRMYFGNRKSKYGKYTLVELPTEQSPFSFFNILFIHPIMAKNEAVLTHEKIHIREKHSIDIILLELLKIICWFNPVIYFIKNDLRLLHEYIADENTTTTIISKHEYAMFLIENSISAFSPSFVNHFFNQPTLKNRIKMLNKEKTANRARLKYLLTIPLGIGLLCVSTLSFSKSYGYIDLLPEKSFYTDVQEKPKAVNIKRDQVKFPPQIVKTDSLKKQNPKRDQIKFPPTYKPKNQTSFYPLNHYKNQKAVQVDNRLIIINGLKVEDNSKFYGVTNSDEVLILNSTEAVKKYGPKAKYGAVEISGNVKETDLAEPPPSLYKLPIEIDRTKGELLSFSTITGAKSLTIYDRFGTIVYNNTAYNDDWNAKKGNYGKFEDKEVARGTYYFFVKVNEEPEKSQRGSIIVK